MLSLALLSFPIAVPDSSPAKFSSGFIKSPVSIVLSTSSSSSSSALTGEDGKDSASIVVEASWSFSRTDLESKRRIGLRQRRRDSDDGWKGRNRLSDRVAHSIGWQGFVRVAEGRTHPATKAHSWHTNRWHKRAIGTAAVTPTTLFMPGRSATESPPMW